MKKLLFVVIIISNILLSCISYADNSFIFKLQWPENAGNFKFNSPKGIDFDSSGYIYVVDSENNSIQKFDSFGRFVKRFDQSKMSSPSGIAIFRKYSKDEKDDIYVVETNNCRVQKFNSDGEPLAKWGKSGSKLNEFNSPQGICVDSNGNIYVADTGNNRIQKFDRNFDGKGTSCIFGTLTLEYNLSSPQDIAVDPNTNNVFVVDTNNNRILKFDSEGKYPEQIGTYTTDSGTENIGYPTGIAFSKGNLYVIDNKNQKVKVFDINGRFLEEWGEKGITPGKFQSPYRIIVTPDDNIYITDTQNRCVQKFDNSGEYIDIWSEYSNEIGKFNFPTDLAIDSNDKIYVVDTGNNRIQKFNSTGGVITTWGEESTVRMENGNFSSPYGIAIDKNDNNRVYVADTKNNRIQIFYANGVYIKKWGWKGTGELENQAINNPQGISIDSNNNVYVVDTNNYRIKVFDNRGAAIKILGNSSDDNIQLLFPLQIAINSKGKIYVVDNLNYCVKVFEKDGAYLGKLGKMGLEDGEFQSPYDVAIDSNDNVYVLDAVRCSIQVFNNNNDFITKFGSNGSGQGEFISPRGIAIDSKNNIYIADTGNHRIQRFAPCSTTLIPDSNVDKNKKTESSIEVHNSPNPFNPKNENTRIIYSLGAESTTVTIRIYNLSGELIKTICEDKSISGNGEEQWDGRIDGDIAHSGIYFAVVKTPKQTSICKIAVIKE